MVKPIINYFSRNIQPKYKIIGILFSLFLYFWMLIVLIPQGIRNQTTIQLILLATVFCYAIWKSIDSAFFWNESELSFDAPHHIRTYIFSLFLILITACLPLLYNRFLYYDDWFIVGSNFFTTIESLIFYGRPIQNILYSLFYNFSVDNSYFIKWFYFGALYLLSILTFKNTLSLSKNKKLAFFISITIFVSNSTIDILGYTSTSPVIFSYLFAGLSYIKLRKQFTFPLRVLDVFNVFVLILASTLIYQLGLQIIALFVILDLIVGNTKRDVLKSFFAGTLLIVAGNLIYLGLYKLMYFIYPSVAVSPRGDLISTISEIKAKIIFFINVLKQMNFQLINNLTFGEFFKETYRGYYINPLDQYSRVIIFFVFIIFLIFMANLIGFGLKSRWLNVILIIISLPFSYYTFLVLKTDGYLMHYAFPLFSIWIVLFIFLPFMIFKENKNFIYIFSTLISIIIISSHLYSKNFYYQYNNSYYQFIRNSIIAGYQPGITKGIHLFGKISPLNAEVYNEFVTKQALNSLGITQDSIRITYSNDSEFLTIIPEDVFQKMVIGLSDSDNKFLNSYYSYDKYYDRYIINHHPQSFEEIQKLKSLFLKEKLIPDPNDTSILIIDLRWTDKVYFNNPH